MLYLNSSAAKTALIPTHRYPNYLTRLLCVTVLQPPPPRQECCKSSASLNLPSCQPAAVHSPPVTICPGGCHSVYLRGQPCSLRPPPSCRLSSRQCIVPAHGRALVRTELAIAVPEGHYGRIGSLPSPVSGDGRLFCHSRGQTLDFARNPRGSGGLLGRLMIYLS